MSIGISWQMPECALSLKWSNNMKNFCLFLLAALIPLVASASRVSSDTDYADVSLIVGKYSKDSGVIEAALQYKIADGWTIYWRDAGDNGYPQNVTWANSSNIQDVTIFWPPPIRHSYNFSDDFYSESYVYEKQAVFPLTISTEDSSKEAVVNLNVDFAICKDVCVSEHVQLSVDVASGYSSSEDIAFIEAAKSHIPKENGAGDLSINDVKLYQNDEGQRLVVKIDHPDDINVKDVFIEADNKFYFYKPKRTGSYFDFDVNPIADIRSLENKDITLTVDAGSFSVEKKLNVGKAISEEIFKPESETLIMLIVFGLIGGFILNFMPCVLPVLSIKLLSVIKHGGGDKKYVVTSFLTTSLGIISSFFFLALVVILFRQAGVAVGWGFHFQQPAFIIAMVIILSLFAANLWEFFEIRGLSIGQKTHDKSNENSLIGYFLTGVLATILATPCTAPFLGTAVGFAIGRSPLDIIIVFLAIGFGMSLPYLIGSFFPQMITKLPKPGKWMVAIKRLMGWFLAATAIWLIWVLSSQIGIISAIILAVITVIKLIKIWITNNTNLYVNKNIGHSFIILFIILSFILPLNYAEKNDNNAGGDIWEEFRPGHISNLVENGKIVFVDVTANWCLTCKFNKYSVLDREQIKEEFIRRDVVAMQADWTLRNDEIEMYLSKYKRSGIPFNIVYGPSAPNGIILSELLDLKSVIEALDKAGQKK